MTENQEQKAMDEIRFMQLVAMFQMAAMQQMGKIASPVTNEIERDLDQARHSIDILETLERKTDGNRTEGEEEMLRKVLFELRMNFVDETKRQPEAPADDDSASESATEGESDDTTAS